jgi:hypothetical protein
MVIAGILVSTRKILSENRLRVVGCEQSYAARTHPNASPREREEMRALMSAVKAPGRHDACELRTRMAALQSERSKRA